MVLCRKRRAFVEAYLCCWCAAEAARRAGYSERTADRQGSRRLKNVGIQRLIGARLAEMAMRADEVLMRLADQARADIGEMMLPDGTISLSLAKELGITRLIKSINDTEKGLRVELRCTAEVQSGARLPRARVGLVNPTGNPL